VVTAAKNTITALLAHSNLMIANGVIPMINRLFKKRHAPKWVGVFKFNFVQMLGYIGFYTVITLTALAKAAFGALFPWLTWPVLIGIILVGGAVLYTLQHVYGSYIDIDRGVDLAWDAKTKNTCYMHYLRLSLDLLMKERGIPEKDIIKIQKQSGIDEWDKRDKKND
jgi:hypothetical protein